MTRQRSNSNWDRTTVQSVSELHGLNPNFVAVEADTDTLVETPTGPDPMGLILVMKNVSVCILGS